MIIPFPKVTGHKIIKNSSEIKIGDEITTNLYSGTVISTVKEIK